MFNKDSPNLYFPIQKKWKHLFRSVAKQCIENYLVSSAIVSLDGLGFFETLVQYFANSLNYYIIRYSERWSTTKESSKYKEGINKLQFTPDPVAV